MRSILTATACIALFTGLCLAETFTGKLIDASCADQQENQHDTTMSCAPTAATTAYAIDVSGKMYQLDENGNAKAAEAMKDRADRMSDPNATQQPNSVTAKVNGKLEGKMLKVESIEIQ